jgi:transposase InsO family protein
MDERVHFISDYLEGDWTMSELCALYGISRPTGYKWLGRYREEGAGGLCDRSSAPLEHGRRTAAVIADGLCGLRRQRPSWGPKKLIAWLEQKQPGVGWPSPSTAGAILKRAGLVADRKPRRRAPRRLEALTTPLYPNHVWAADHKGWIDTPYGARLEPLTVTDSFTRYLISLSATQSTGANETHPLFQQAFEDHGLPETIRTDNGAPFCAASITGLTELSAHWARLGIAHERIDPGRPQQNGRHERFHLTLKEAMLPPESSQEAQQRRFDLYRKDYNHDRPHEALGQKPPGQFYQPSPRSMPSGRPEPDYPAEATIRKVRSTGEIKWRGQMIYISNVIAGEAVALTEIDDNLWKLQFYNRPLGVIDPTTLKLTRLKLQPAKGGVPDKM